MSRHHSAHPAPDDPHVSAFAVVAVVALVVVVGIVLIIRGLMS